MVAFTDADLSAMRVYFAALACKDDCLVQRGTAGTPDGMGSPPGGLTTIGTVKVDAVRPGAGMLVEQASQVGAQLTWQLSFPWGTDIRKLDTLTIRGKLMLVQALLDPDSFDVFTVVEASVII